MWRRRGKKLCKTLRPKDSNADQTLIINGDKEQMLFVSFLLLLYNRGDKERCCLFPFLVDLNMD